MRLTARLLALLASSGALAAQPPPCASGGGSCPEAGEAEEEAALLQTRREGEERWGGPKYYVQIAPPDKIPVDRYLIKEGHVREVIIKYPMNGQIKINGKTAKLNMHEMMTGTFARDSHGEAAVEADPLQTPESIKSFGVEKGFAFVSPQSMVSTKVKLAFAEKTHTLWVPDEAKMMRNSEIVATKKYNSQTKKQRQQAVEDSPARNAALSSLSMPTGTQVLMAGKDWDHIDDLRNYTKKNRAPRQQDMQDMDKMRQILKERQQKYTAKVPLSETIGCLHFEGAELMTFEENQVTVPLDTNIVAWRGQLGSIPNKWYSMASGIAIFHFNKEEDTFEIYFRFSTSVDIVDQSTAKKEKYIAAFIEGPVNGEKKYKVGKDGRHGSFSIPFLGAHYLREVMSYQEDYSFLHSKREDVGCDDKVLNSLLAGVDKFQDGFSMNSNGQTQVKLSAGWQATMNDEVKCAVEYLKPVNDSAVVAYGRLLAVGLVHVLIEMPGKVMVAAFSNSEQWNDFALP